MSGVMEVAVMAALLAAISAADPAAVPLWAHYLERWTRLNTLRTVAAAAAVLLFLVGLRH